MLGNLLGLAVLLAVATVFGWITVRAWRARNALLKWAGAIAAGLVTLLAALVSVAAARGLYAFYGPPSVSPAPVLAVAGTPEQIERGEHLATLCAGCHSATAQLPLSGGADLGQDSPVPLGELIPANLTPAGPLKDWSDGEIFRAIRDGVDRDGRRLVAMSTFVAARHLSDEDLQAVIAYLRSQPAAPDLPKSGDYPSLLLAILIGGNVLPAEAPLTGPVTAPPKGPSAEYGEYIAAYVGCAGCHGADLSGSPAGGLGPSGPSLRVVKGWTQAEFQTTLRTGVDPAGHAMDPVQMPWQSIGHLDDEELAALYTYLTSLP